MDTQDKNQTQQAVDCLFMRGGTSRGPFFRAADLPTDLISRDALLLAIMGSPDTRQIDGLGGAHPLTSKVGIVGPGREPGVDLEFLFAQVAVDQARVDTTPNCGNMLAAVVPFALETGLVAARGECSSYRVLTLNTGMLCDIEVQTPGGQLRYDGTARIDGVPGTAAPIAINFLDTAGSVCDSLLPTGHALDRLRVPGQADIDVTCIDNGMPMVLMRASDLQRRGDESVAELNADEALKVRLEALRLAAAERMGLGDVRDKPYPKMCLLSPPLRGGSIATRCFIPHVCHDAIGVLAAVTVATACVLPGSVADGLARLPGGTKQCLPVEHPSGEFSVELELDASGQVSRAALLRTARLLMRGTAYAPRMVSSGESA
ncbi:4-oxalomesaconate tautomerase [Bordetella holmesii]|uniref:PrpF protein n=2 Tax=Bordetella holmesii TaxID=35814 RepID=A0A158M0N6_9BORD|nr:4-oxalomesaconate tautomerase [Bordetella holmesii]AHV92512.1 prpF family protein [Bordetella holmesii ATCC 51541]AIT25537.1 prpF family protein [Bordetella holmesii 44057]EWM43949.1 prpF family protein [Bordetella holmesii 41130]EWM46103.1 prpF family protein [Bordetella holmesii 35009]EWM50258.1 prpF family protein [Bordetella holmesii 70147]